jgi:hypothetical protein
MIIYESSLKSYVQLDVNVELSSNTMLTTLMLLKGLITFVILSLMLMSLVCLFCC